jgi:hypothetical protein
MDTLEKIIGVVVTLILGGAVALGYTTKADKEVTNLKIAALGDDIGEIKDELKEMNTSLSGINLSLAGKNGEERERAKAKGAKADG